MENLLKGSSELNQMFAALQRTGSSLRRDFGEVEQLQQSLPGARDFVAKAASRIEEMILSDLTLVRPSAGLLTPNVSRDGDGISEFLLSLSGAANFVRGNPHFAISLALRINDETRIGLIYSPIDDRLYYAEKGSGMFIFSAFHSARIRVSKLKEPHDLTVGCSTPGSWPLNLGVRRITGCPALDLAWVAAGKFDAFISEPLDYAELAAGELMVSEAGGKIWETDGQLFVTNGIVEI
ncbi:MAG: inositol monophosphatase [Alphaproteobacteria bacterium]|nr:inositol monophosphatase [Alphaproteobacteria bacterium]